MKSNKNKKDKKAEDKKEEDKKNKKSNEKPILKLSDKSHLSDFILDPENEYGKSYKLILQKFIERQNDELTGLLQKNNRW